MYMQNANSLCAYAIYNNVDIRLICLYMQFAYYSYVDMQLFNVNMQQNIMSTSRHVRLHICPVHISSWNEYKLHVDKN